MMQPWDRSLVHALSAWFLGKGGLECHLLAEGKRKNTLERQG